MAISSVLSGSMIMRYIHHEGTGRWIFFLCWEFQTSSTHSFHHSLHPIDLCNHIVNEMEELLWLKDSWDLSRRWSQHNGGTAQNTLVRAIVAVLSCPDVHVCACFGGGGRCINFSVLFLLVFSSLYAIHWELLRNPSFSQWKICLAV